MRYPTQVVLIVAAVFCFVLPRPIRAETPEAPQVPSSRAVLKVMKRVAGWQLTTPITEKPAAWTMGTLYVGLSALSQIVEDTKYETWLLDTCEKATSWQVGRYRYYADDQCVGQVYLELYLRHRQPKMIADVRKQFDAILKRPVNHGLEYVNDSARRDEWCWCDALFMAPPVWMRLYAATGEKAYMDFAVERWWKTSDYLYDKDERLYFRDSTFFKEREANGRKIFWGRGNGWVMGGLVRVMQFLPADHPSRPRFEQQFREMAGSLLACQQSDGLWRSSLLDPEHYPLPETSGTGLHCYAFAWGVNEGLLDREKYEPAAVRAWLGLLSCVTPQGKLTNVQPVGDHPVKLKADNSDVYGVGAFLLAGSEMFKLAEKRETGQ
jgi:unsaturated rhamnogalacturonyl hydrolase